MTIEEIIKRGNEKFPQDIIEIINDDGSITREDVNFKLRKAYIEGLIDNNISLPSNLDEAAEKAYKEYDVKTAVKPKEHPVGFLFFDGFKVGAEWMAGQGSSYEGVIYDDHEVLVGGYSIEFRDFFLPFKNCDEVIVQIRKKQ